MLAAASAVTLDGYLRVAVAAPDEELLGKSKGYPRATRATWYLDDSRRVASYTNLDELFPRDHHVLRKAANPSPLARAAPEPALRYRFGGRTLAIDDYLANQRVTGLLVIKDGDAAKFASLHASKGSIPAILAFNQREAAEGARFRYASIETQVLTLVLCAATGKSLADYLGEKLWQPMGAEAEATWITGPDGLERGASFFSATLRDWGRLGLLLANDGALAGRQIIPGEYLLEATDWHKHRPRSHRGCRRRRTGMDITSGPCGASNGASTCAGSMARRSTSIPR